MKPKDWLELTMPERTLVLEQISEQQKATGRAVTSLEINLRLQEVLERTAAYDMSLMDEEQNQAYMERLRENRERLEKKKAVLCGNTETA
jgi:hypothetical protein